MNPIIYVDGKLADQLGFISLKQLGQQFADRSQQTVDVLTHGHSEHHGNRRMTFEPEKENHK